MVLYNPFERSLQRFVYLDPIPLPLVLWCDGNLQAISALAVFLPRLLVLERRPVKILEAVVVLLACIVGVALPARQQHRQVLRVVVGFGQVVLIGKPYVRDPIAEGDRKSVGSRKPEKPLNIDDRKAGYFKK